MKESKNQLLLRPISGDLVGWQDKLEATLEDLHKAREIAERRELELRLQKTLLACPGYMGSIAPCDEHEVGWVLVDSNKTSDAFQWLATRYHVNPVVKFERHNGGMKIEIARIMRGTNKGQKRSKPRFKKPEQFNLPL